jgi:hypothetical protein
MEGLVVFSFALREEEPSPCNVRLAEATERILAKAKQLGDVLVVAQWEVAKKLEQDGVGVDLVVLPNTDASYLDTKDVWDQAQNLFQRRGVVTVILVAQPFLHLSKVKQLIHADNYVVDVTYLGLIGRIGFDKESLQSWTRGPVRLFCMPSARHSWVARATLRARGVVREKGWVRVKRAHPESFMSYNITMKRKHSFNIALIVGTILLGVLLLSLGFNQNKKVEETKQEEPAIIETQKPAPKTVIRAENLLLVPYTVQAPLVNWNIHEQSCEEAALLMAHYYLEGSQIQIIPPQTANQELINMVAWQKSNYGEEKDLNLYKVGKLAQE